ncbi:MAG: hypothetical protein GY801_52610 [bacterium]|nr:hypothetical protein [bacterium]
MSIKTYVTTSNPNAVSSLKTEEAEILTTLGTDEETIAVKLQELFESVSEAITPNLKTEGQLTVEITGSVSLKAQGGMKYLFFNIGGETGSTDSMKVTLSAKLNPNVDE